MNNFEVVIDSTIADAMGELHIFELQALSNVLEEAGFSAGDEVTITIKPKQ